MLVRFLVNVIPNAMKLVACVVVLFDVSPFHRHNSFYLVSVAELVPLVIANGGSSGIYPDQTDPAYYDAANSTAFPLAFLCDLQLTKDNLGVCRTGWNLSQSTNLTNILTNTSTMSTYVIQGVAETAYFSVDFNLTQLNQTTGEALCLQHDY